MKIEESNYSHDSIGDFELGNYLPSLWVRMDFKKLRQENYWLFFLLDVRGDDPEKVIGGIDVHNIEKYPFMVSIRLRGSHICGGSIVSEYHILTAAHCIVGVKDSSLKSVKIGTGDHRFEKSYKLYGISKMIYPKGYDEIEVSPDHDIGIIKVIQYLDLIYLPLIYSLSSFSLANLLNSIIVLDRSNWLLRIHLKTLKHFYWDGVWLILWITSFRKFYKRIEFSLWTLLPVKDSQDLMNQICTFVATRVLAMLVAMWVDFEF